MAKRFSELRGNMSAESRARSTLMFNTIHQAIIRHDRVYPGHPRLEAMRYRLCKVVDGRHKGGHDKGGWLVGAVCLWLTSSVIASDERSNPVDGHF